MSDARVTRLLRAARGGDPTAQAELLPHVYSELRRRAGGYMRRERRDHTLQPTAIVHEAYLKLVNQRTTWKDRAHFFGIASRLMRRILLDYARKHNASKRGGLEQQIRLDDAVETAARCPREVIAVNDALDALAVEFPREARVVELIFFGRCTQQDVAQILSVSVETVKRDWAFAKRELRRTLQP